MMKYIKIDKAIEAGKIKPAARQAWCDLYDADSERTINLIEGLSSYHAAVQAVNPINWEKLISGAACFQIKGHTAVALVQLFEIREKYATDFLKTDNENSRDHLKELIQRTNRSIKDILFI